ncbi:ArsC family reductase [Sphingomonas rhizophila]|uniref:ArsC family reductase n=1 Tax=Sphingomonas rhizophila TaxID=2071607 RepID=A0A7G9S9E5_9SPHN|nr:ArsC family reductase [Sphingomonas rhizophila]QNN64470.1 ArsC family reductase [Sphingomonas rhizophila]
MITLYGIPNCDTVKKARSWLEARGVAYAFHDYKKAGADPALLKGWADELGWEALLNRSGTTFRKLDEADKTNLDEDKAIMLMAMQPSLIRRPLLDKDGELIVGFKQSTYEDAGLA